MYKEALTGPWAQTFGNIGTGVLANSLMTAAPIVASPIPGIAGQAISTANGVGGLDGMFQPPSRKDIKNYEKSKALNMIPGVSTFRMNQRRKQLASRYGGGAGFQKPVSQSFGWLSSAALLALAGAGIGAGIGAIANGKQGAKAGLGLGAGIGGGLGVGASGVGALTALLTKTRDSKAQKQYEKGATAPNYIVPGLGTYNASKSLGHILNSPDYLKNL